MTPLRVKDAHSWCERCVHRALFTSGGTRGRHVDDLLPNSIITSLCVHVITEGFWWAVTGRLDDALTAGGAAFCAQQSLIRSVCQCVMWCSGGTAGSQSSAKYLSLASATKIKCFRFPKLCTDEMNTELEALSASPDRPGGATHFRKVQSF